MLMPSRQNPTWGVVTLCKEEPISVLYGEDEGMPEEMAGRWARHLLRLTRIDTDSPCMTVSRLLVLEFEQASTPPSPERVFAFT